MDQVEVMAKLKGLRSNVFDLQQHPTLLYEPGFVLDLFTRYDSIHKFLQSELPSLFGDLPNRRVRKAVKGRTTYIRRESLDALLRDCDYCLETLSSIAISEVPSMKVTREGVFFAGQYFDALQRLAEILGQAQGTIAIIDAYMGDTVLNLLTAKHPEVNVNILTKEAPAALIVAANAFNKQYGKLSIRTSNAFHDRFVIVDDRDFYHFGASLKDLGNRGFMFSRIEELEVIAALQRKFAQEWRSAKTEV